MSTHLPGLELREIGPSHDLRETGLSHALCETGPRHVLREIDPSLDFREAALSQELRECPMQAGRRWRSAPREGAQGGLRLGVSGPGGSRKVDVKIPGKGNSTSHGARPVHLIITMIEWIRTSRLPANDSCSRAAGISLSVYLALSLCLSLCVSLSLPPPVSLSLSHTYTLSAGIGAFAGAGNEGAPSQAGHQGSTTLLFLLLCYSRA